MEEKVITAVQTCMTNKQMKNEVKLTSNLREDLGYDSMDTLMLISELEAAFGIEIDENDFSDVITVGDILEKLKGAV